MLCPEAIGSKSAELTRILLLHSLTQHDGIVASPPIGGSSHKKPMKMQDSHCIFVGIPTNLRTSSVIVWVYDVV